MSNPIDTNELKNLIHEVEPLIDNLNKTIIINDMNNEDIRVLSEIGLTAKQISEKFYNYKQNFLSNSYAAIDLMINTTMFDNIEYHTAISYALHLNELLNDTIEEFFVTFNINKTKKEHITKLQNLIFDWKKNKDNTDSNISTSSSPDNVLNNIDTQNQSAILRKSSVSTDIKLPDNISQLNGLFDNIPEETLDFVDDFIFEATDNLNDTEKLLLQLENNFDDVNIVNSIFRHFHSIKGTSGFFSFEEISTVAHLSETLLDKCRNKEIDYSTDLLDTLFNTVNTLKSLIVNVQLKTKEIRKEINKADLTEIIIEPLLKDLIRFISKKPVDSSEKPSNIKKTNKDISLKNTTVSKFDSKNIIQDSIRVPTLKIDNVHEMIGELLISVSILKQSVLSEEIVSKKITDKINYLDMISEQLQQSILKIRMFPIKSVYDKLKLLVRDLTNKSGKKVKFDLYGETTEVDKNIIDDIFSPLTHLIRNSMDHGIEENNVRKEKGKNEYGYISLKTENIGDNIIIELYDDGGGLDKENILKKAIDNQIVDNPETLTEKDIFSLIFKPGFSTSNKLTEISGRGVGMDVVKKTIKKIGGKILIDSKYNEYTKFTIFLPLSTSIIDGLIVKSGDNKFIFPILKIIHTLDVNKVKPRFALDKSTQYIIFNNKSTPLISLQKFFYNRFSSKIESGVILITEYENNYFGLVADDILMKQKIVAKSLGNKFKNIPAVKCATILGDGSVGLIIEPDEIIKNGR